MPFFGREKERRIAEAIVGPQGGLCLFLGDAGIGKSALARELARQFDTVVVAVSPSERMWPLSGLSAFAAGLGGARGAALDSVLARGHDWPEYMLAEEVNRTLHLVRDEPSVLVIDDLGEMDSTSLTVLSFVFGRLWGTGVSVVATANAIEGRHDLTATTHTRIERLSFDESLELARATLGPSANPAVLRIVAALTGGDPGTLTRVHLTPEEAAGDTPLPSPLRLVDDAGRRRRAGARRAPDPAVTAILDLLSVGPVYAYDRLCSAVEESGIEIDTLIDGGLVTVHGDLVQIADPALRLRHHTALSSEQRRRLHARAAEDHAGGVTAIRQWHESFLEPTGDRHGLLTAAVEFARTAETFAAIEFAERALSGDLDEASRTRELVELGDALVLRGEAVLGQHYLGRAGISGESDVCIRAALASVRAGADVDYVVELALPAGTTPEGDPATVERLLCESARHHLSVGEVDRAIERVVAAVNLGVASAETTLVVRVLREMGVDDPFDLGAREQDEGAADSETPIELAALSLTVRLFQEDYTAVRRQVGALLSHTPRLAPMWRERLLRILVSAEVRGGDPVAARDAVAAWRHEWSPGREPDAASTLLLAQVAAMDPADRLATELVERGRDLCRRGGTPALLPFFAALEGGLALAQGRPDDAVHTLLPVRGAVPSADPALLRTEADLIEAFWLSDRPIDARRELAHLELRAARRPRRWTTLALARSRAVCRADREGAAAFRAAEAVYRTDDGPYEHLRLRESRERCRPIAERGRVDTIMPRSAPDSALSPDEQEVIALVKQGLRNREIAAALFISLRSVELRLTRIYRELGVSSRTQLVAYLHGAARA